LGGDGGEGLAIVEFVHFAMEILERSLTLVFSLPLPLVVNPAGAAAKHSAHHDGVAVAHSAGVFPCGDIQPLMQ